MTRVRGWCPECGGPLWRTTYDEENAGIANIGHPRNGARPSCRLCNLAELPRFDTCRDWRGRVDEANAWEPHEGMFDSAASFWSSAPDQLRRELEADQRPRAIIEEGPEPGSEEARAMIGVVRVRLAYDGSLALASALGYGHAADARIGHTVPPILRPAYDSDGRPLREAMNTYLRTDED